jgi:hypothetical protein
MAKTKEEEIATAILSVAIANGGLATFKKAYSEIPKLIKLTPHDTALSGKRPGEAMWQQIVRNIKSHFESPDNFINRGYLVHVPRVGYKITDAGRKFLES